MTTSTEPATAPAGAGRSRSEITYQVIDSYFGALAAGDLDAAMALLSEDVRFELPADRYNAVIPYLGVHQGKAAVIEAFRIRAETTEVRDYGLRDLRAQDDTGFAVIWTRAVMTRTGQEFGIEDAHRLTVGADGLISSWKVYFDPNGEIAAFDADREQRLLAAVRGADPTLARELLGQGADPNHREPETGLTPLLIAAGLGDPVLVRILLEAGADVFAVDGRAGAGVLHKACQGGNLEVARILVEAGAFVDAVAATTGHTPLMDALWFAFPDIAGLLLDAGAGLNLSTHYGFSLQEHFAYELAVNTRGRDRLLAAEQLLKARLAADAAGLDRQQLMAAVVAGDLEQVRRLLAAGAEVDERGPRVNGFNDGHTPLLVAARDGHDQIVAELLTAGADVNAVEPVFGAVPLHKAVYNGHAGITAQLVVRPGVQMSVQGATNGYSPLHDALWHGYEECARILVEAGADLTGRGHDGKTPLDLAVAVFGADHPLTGQIARLGNDDQGVI